MNERFDDMIRRRLQGHESNVPEGLFDEISKQPKVQNAFFDDAIRGKLASAESGLPDDMFDAISTAAELEHLPFDSAVRATLEPYDSTVPTGLFEAVSTIADLEHLGFDSTIRAKLEPLASAVPADMWQRIAAEKDRRRRPVAWWWMAATILLLTGGIGTAFLWKTRTEKLLPETTLQKKPVEQPHIILPKKSAKDDEIATAVSNNKTVAQLSNSKGNAWGVASTSQKINDSLPTATHASLVVRQAGIYQKNRLRNSSAQQPGTTYKPTEEAPYNLQAGSALLTTSDVSLATAHLSILGLLRNAGRLAPEQLLKAKPHAPVIPCPTNGDEKRNDWYVDVYGSAFLLQKNIQDKDAGKNAKAGFDTTLHRQVSFNAGISLVKSLGENFLLKTGLQYNRINESFRLTQINERRLITTISVRTVILSPGDTVRIRDTSTVEQIGTALHRTQNRYTQLDVPLIIGYEFGGENIRLNANAGVIANIRSSYQGEMLADSTKQIFDINNYHGQPIYRKTVGFSLYAGLSIIKPLTEKMSLLIEPHARIGLGNTTNSNAWFSQKNGAMGLSIGLRYKFSGGRQRIY